MCEICGEYVVPYQVQALGIFLLAEVIQYVASLSVENTHGLGKVVPLHDAALTGVQSCQHTLAPDLEAALLTMWKGGQKYLESVVCSSVVKIMAHTGYNQGKSFQITLKSNGNIVLENLKKSHLTSPFPTKSEFCINK